MDSDTFDPYYNKATVRFDIKVNLNSGGQLTTAFVVEVEEDSVGFRPEHLITMLEAAIDELRSGHWLQAV